MGALGCASSGCREAPDPLHLTAVIHPGTATAIALTSRAGRRFEGTRRVILRIPTRASSWSSGRSVSAVDA
jgi:hypothetical protein